MQAGRSFSQSEDSEVTYTREQRRDRANAVKLFRNKYRAIKTVVDGITFDSKLEASRYRELKMLEKAGEIFYLSVHTRWPLVYGQSNVIGHYESDFDYFTDASRILRVIEDCKGVRTSLYRWKKKHFELQYPFKITEIPAKKSMQLKTLRFRNPERV